MSRDRKPRVALDVRGLIGDHAVFRINGTLPRDPTIDTWLAGDPADLRALAQEWFALMRRCGDDVRELMHDGCPVACVGDAPFAYVNTFKNHVNVGFFNGAMLGDPAGLLEGTGKRMRHVKLLRDAPIAAENLRDLIQAAYTDIKHRA